VVNVTTAHQRLSKIVLARDRLFDGLDVEVVVDLFAAFAMLDVEAYV